MLDSPGPDDRGDRAAADLTVAVHRHRGHALVVLSGEMDLTTVFAIECELAALRAAGFDNIVLDLRAVTYIDSSGLRLLLTETRKARHGGYRFRLTNAPPVARRLIAITGARRALEFIQGPGG